MTATLGKTHARTSARPRNKALHIALWVVQVMLAFAFGMAGVMKSTQPIDALRTSMAWVAAVPPGMVRFIGMSEFLGAIGILLPALTRIKPRLTPLAAVGLALIMGMAIVFHLTRGEANLTGIPFTLGLLAAFVAWGRFRKAPIAPRG